MPISFLQHELTLFFAFSWRDWSATIIPGLLSAIYPVRDSRSSLVEITPRFIFLIVWLTTFVYFLDLSNQIVGVEEDRINKPDRPIPSGKVSLDGAKRRWVIVTSFFLSLIVLEPLVWAETLCWIAATGFANTTRYGNHWVGKNLIGITAGAWAILSAARKCIDPTNPVDQTALVSIAIWCGTAIQCQDLRDIAGDKAIGRHTMPVDFGDLASRWVMALGCLPAAMAALWYGDVLQLAPISICALHGMLAYKILTGRNAYADHKTYMLFTYIFCFIVAVDSFRGVELEAKIIDLTQKTAVQIMKSTVPTIS